MKDRLKRVSTTVLLGVVLGVVFAFLAVKLIDSPEERMLKGDIYQYRKALEVLNQRVERASHVLADIEERDSTVSLEQRLYAQSVSLDEIYRMAGTKQQRMATMPAIMPIKKEDCRIVSGFGMRYHPILHYRRMHTGVDLSAQPGTPVHATGDGRVTVTGRGEGLGGYGICVVVDHGYGFKTLYAHLSEVTVSQGERVTRGKVIGKVGRTGLAQGYHLHYEVIQNGNKVNPVYYFFNDLTPAEYDEVLEASYVENQCLS